MILLPSKLFKICVFYNILQLSANFLKVNNYQRKETSKLGLLFGFISQHEFISFLYLAHFLHLVVLELGGLPVLISFTASPSDLS